MTPQDTASNLLGYAQQQYWSNTPTGTTTTAVPQVANQADLNAAVQTLGSPTAIAPTAQAAPTDTAAATGIQSTNLQKNIKNLIGEALGVYDTLYGNLNTAAASQKKALENRFGTETGALSQQFAQEIPRIGQAYAALGAYDSSWRGQAEAQAKQNFQNQLDTIRKQQEADMAKLGQEVTTQQAQFQSGQTGLNQLLAQIPGTTDINSLTTLQNEIQKKINELKSSAAGLQSQESYIQKFQGISPTTDRTAQLKQTLSNIIQGEAPLQLKQSVGAQIIGSAGLTPEEQQRLLTDFNSQLAPATVPATA